MKKLTSLILCLAMLITMGTVLSVGSSAAEAEFVKWDGTSDISWFSTTNPESSYNIDSPAKLAGLAQIVNEQAVKDGYAKGITFYITVNIDFDGKEWTPIGYTNDATFGGTLEGKLGGVTGASVTFKNFTLLATSQNAGLVGTQAAGDIRNITMVDTMISTDKNTIGSFVGYARGEGSTYENLISDAEITTMGLKWVGGIVGYCNAENIAFSGCAYNGSITAFSACTLIGGLTGQTTSDTTVENVYIGGLINCDNSSSKYIGGVIGRAGTKAPSIVIKNLHYDGVVLTRATQGGAIIGRLDANAESEVNLVLENVLNTGVAKQNYSPISKGMSWVGFVGGYEGVVNATFTSCYAMASYQLLSSCDYDSSKSTITANVTVNGVRETPAITARTSLGKYKTTAVKLDAIKGEAAKTALSGFLWTAADWAVRADGYPTLAFAEAYADKEYMAADLSWLDTENETGIVLTKEAEVVGLKKVLLCYDGVIALMVLEGEAYDKAHTHLPKDVADALAPDAAGSVTTEGGDETDPEPTKPVETEPAPTEPEATNPQTPTTEAPDTTPTEESGCGSALAGALAIVAVLGTAISFKRK